MDSIYGGLPKSEIKSAKSKGKQTEGQKTEGQKTTKSKPFTKLESKIPNINQIYAKYKAQVARPAYINSLGLTNVTNIKLQRLLTQIANMEYTERSMKSRIAVNLQRLKYVYNIRKASYSTACFRVGDQISSCVFGFIYYDTIKNKTGGYDFIPCFCSSGSTFDSQDGEYRGRFIKYDQFIKVSQRYHEAFDFVEELILDKLKTSEINLGIEFFYPEYYNKDKNKAPHKTLTEIVDETRIAIKLYVSCWIYDYYQCYFEYEENHINADYKRILYKKKDKPYFDELIDRITLLEYNKLNRELHLYYKDVGSADGRLARPGAGQKLFPINMIEELKLEDINYGVWREIYISNLAANLVLNFISPSFPFIIDWFYVQNIRREAFNNAATHLKYEHSIIAEDIMRQLLAVDKLNYENQNREQGPISHKFQRLSKMMHRDMVYVDSDIKLAKDSICVVIEYAGRTLKDIPRLIQHDTREAIIKATAFAPLFQTFDLFIKHYFEYMYGVYCLNTKLQMIHGDLHANNMTITQVWRYYTDEGVPTVHNPHAIYIIGNTVYCFKHTGSYSILIDFSRSIIGDYSRIEHEFGPIYASLYFKDQHLRIIQLIQSQLPDIYDQYGAILVGLLETNFVLIFKFLTIIDGLSITKNLWALLASEKIRTKLNVDESIISFLKKQTDYVNSYVDKLLENILSGNIKRADEIEWPLLSLIQEIFRPWEKNHDDLKSDTDLGPQAFHLSEGTSTRYTTECDPQNKKIVITDIFNHNNNIIYDIEDPPSWGPLLSVDEYVKFMAKNHQPEDDDVVRWRQHKRDESKAINDIFESIEKEEYELLRFENWMMI